MGSGDVVSQVFIENKALDYEWRRTARFFVIGTIFVVS